MNAVITARPKLSLATAGDSRSTPTLAERTPTLSEGDPGETPTSRGFVTMLWVYRATGGTARGDDLAQLFEQRQQGNYLSLARRIAAREVFGFSWRDTYWVPMFQFDLRDLTIKPGTRAVLAELARGFDGWSTASWFARPSTWLQGKTPLELFDVDLFSVVQAARADSFLVNG